MPMRSYRHERDVSAVADLLGSLPAGSRHRIDAGWRLAAPGFADPAENRLFTAEDGTLLGMAGVVPRFRRLGVIRALLDEAARRAAQHDATALYVEADDVNAAALAAYEAAGFVPGGRTERWGRIGFGE
jgi:ribosomal protein S18 acetylase RimI-like enzyme